MQQHTLHYHFPSHATESRDSKMVPLLLLSEPGWGPFTKRPWFDVQPDDKTNFSIQSWEQPESADCRLSTLPSCMYAIPHLPFSLHPCRGDRLESALIFNACPLLHPQPKSATGFGKSRTPFAFPLKLGILFCPTKMCHFGFIINFCLVPIHLRNPV